MKLDVSSPSGEIKQVELEYEGLEKHCFTCHSLSHEKDDCPSQRALVNHRDPAPHMGISQSRTLERIDAERRKAEERRRVRSDSSQWQRPSTREIDWQNDKSFRYNYGARRDPNYRVDNSRRDETAPGSRRPVRERLSLSKDDDLTRSKESHSRRQSKAPTSEWRPVASGSKLGSVQNNALSLVSHTPSPRPQREGGSSIAVGSPASRLGSGGGSAPSQERRSALNRLSLPNERIPILQDGAANPDSGRLKERDTQSGVEAVPSPRSGNLPSDPRNLGTTTGTQYDASQDRSPIRTLSEDRVHVSLRLGPLFVSDEEESLNAQLNPIDPIPRRVGPRAGRNEAVHTTSSRKRGPRSPTQGTTVKRRRVTKIQASPKRRPSKDTGGKGAGQSIAVGTSQPRTSLIPASKKKGTDFRSGPKPLP